MCWLYSARYLSCDSCSVAVRRLTRSFRKSRSATSTSFASLSFTMACSFWSDCQALWAIDAAWSRKPW